MDREDNQSIKDILKNYIIMVSVDSMNFLWNHVTEKRLNGVKKNVSPDISKDGSMKVRKGNSLLISTKAN